MNLIAPSFGDHLDDARIGAHIGHEKSVVHLELIDVTHREIER
jgi:hypothetical protein